MTTKAISATLGLCFTTGLTFSLTNTTTAQVPVTGGRIVYNDVQIFVPDPGNANQNTLIFEGTNPDSFFIRTSQGDIPLNARFEATTLPELSTAPGGIPAVGDTGEVLGTLTFRGFTANGEPGLFSGIPTTLNFSIGNNLVSNLDQAFTQYETPPTTLTEVGSISTPTSFTTVTRTIPVVVVQFQPGTNSPENVTLTNVVPVTDISASLFNTAIPGNSHNASFTGHITGGSVEIPNPPGLNDTGSASGNLTNSGLGFTLLNLNSVIFIERSVTISRTIGAFQFNPTLPTFFVTGIFTFRNVVSGRWVDPPMAEGFEYEMIPRDVPIGIASRVFPGMTGFEEAEDALFTAITGFPKAVDKDDRFTVVVEGKVLGEFGPGDTLNFSDYAEELGELLVNGEGVTKFAIANIEPGVDSSDPRAFPVRLEYSTPTASFEMRALESDVAANSLATEEGYTTVASEMLEQIANSLVEEETSTAKPQEVLMEIEEKEQESSSRLN